jgi:hypothetical protein
MKSPQEEVRAMTELAERAKVLHAPDAHEELARLAPGTVIPEGIEQARPEHVPDVPACCLLLRGQRRFPDNLVGFCADCQEPIQFRPSLPALVKLCAFCCLARTNAKD